MHKTVDARLQAPRPLKQPAPDRLEIREGGGCLSLFGIPFLAAGIFMVLTGLHIISVSNSKELPPWARPAIFLMGVAFVAVGGSLVFGRRWVTLDSGKGIIIKQRGLLVPLRTERFPLCEPDT